MKRRTYRPTETHLALHGQRELTRCRCGVSFAARSAEESDDDPELCLCCARAGMEGWCAPKAQAPAVSTQADVLRLPVRQKGGA